jgi:hypothetical protein
MTAYERDVEGLIQSILYFAKDDKNLPIIKSIVETHTVNLQIINEIKKRLSYSINDSNKEIINYFDNIKYLLTLSCLVCDSLS